MAAQQTEREPPARRHRVTRTQRYLFLVLEGARPTAGGMRIALGTTELAINRGETRSLRRDGQTQVLEVPDARMSGCHAKVVEADGELVLEDRRSTNGTFVNGAAVEAHVLRDGDIIEVGQTTLLYRELEEDSTDRASNLDGRALDGREPGFATFDPSLGRALQRLARVAPSTLPIVLLGDTGTGKEVLARGIHALSQRPGPFVAVNCGAIPENLVESQLFGHVRGAFSGAVKDEAGMVRSANGGTLLLDEIGDLPLSSQAALLRVLQEGEVHPVGASTVTRVDVRVIAATHKPLDDLIARNLFRRDLYARLAGYTFALPRLRERLADLGLIVAALLAGDKLQAPPGLRLQSDVVRAMLRHDWPMNVRELEQCLGAACILAEDGVITVAELPASVAAGPSAVPTGVDATEPTSVDQRSTIVALLAKYEGNLSAVARALRTSRSQLYRLMERYGLTETAR